jgi:hypothetical protein
MMVNFRGERLPGDQRTARLSVRARHCGTVAAGTAYLRAAGQRRGGGGADRGLPPIGRGQAAAPESPSSPAAHPQLLAANLTPPHDFPQRIAIRSRNRPGPERPGPPEADP